MSNTEGGCADYGTWVLVDVMRTIVTVSNERIYDKAVSTRDLRFSRVRIRIAAEPAKTSVIYIQLVQVTRIAPVFERRINCQILLLNCVRKFTEIENICTVL